MIIVAFAYLLLAPFVIGASVGAKKTISEMYIKGFSLHFVIFSVCYIVMLYFFKDRSLLHLAMVFRVLIAPLWVIGIIRIIREKEDYQMLFRNLKLVWHCPKWLLLLALAIVAFHIMRVGVMQPWVTSDSKSYDALVHDMSGTGEMYTRYTDTGMDYHEVSPKLLLVSWYAYEAYISVTCHLHSMIVTATVLPVFLVLMSYMVLWQIGLFAFQEREKQLCFLFICGLISEMQIIFLDEAAYRLVWPVWGKNIIANIACPMIGLAFIKMIRRKENVCKGIVWLFLFSFMGAYCSAAGMMAIPLELGCLSLVFAIHERKLRYIVYSIIAIIPEIFQFAIYILSVGGVLRV